MKQQVFLGRNSIKELISILQIYSSKKIFLVRGKKSYGLCGAKAIIDEVLAVMPCQLTEFYDFEENPKMEDLERGLLLLQQCKPDIIIAIGGGSVLDMAKLLRFFYSYSGDYIGKEFTKERSLLPLIVLPTTAGTGSEATGFAVLYKDGIKYSVEHNDILPNFAIIYPLFTYTNTKYLTACTGFDALAQGIEAYWSVNATEESDEYANRAIKLLWPNLPLAVNTPTDEIRDKLSEGAYWAGCAINIAKTTAPHAFSYPFTTNYGYPHGHAVALTFPFFFKLNTSSYENLKVGIDRVKYANKVDFLQSLLEDDYLSMNEYLQNIMLTKPIRFRKDDILHILKCVNEERLANNPIYITEDIKQDLINIL